MASADSLRAELECVICSEELKQPKYIGPCNHTFCKDCIFKYWVSLGKRRNIPCPQCREQCRIPRGGVDNLKDNFHLSSIIETVRTHKQKYPEPVHVKCTNCSKQGLAFCKTCDMKLCAECKKKHRERHKTRDHNVFYLCLSHGHGMLFYCNDCKEAVCSACRAAKHTDHDVIKIRLLFDDILSRISTLSPEAEDEDFLTELRKEEKKISKLLEVVKDKSLGAEGQTTTAIESDISEKKTRLRSLRAESQQRQNEIDKKLNEIDILLKENSEHDERVTLLVTDVEGLEEEMAKVVAEVREQFASSSEKLEQFINHFKEVEKKKGIGRATLNSKDLDVDNLAKLTAVHQELMDTVQSKSRERNASCLVEEVTTSLGEFGVAVPDDDDDDDGNDDDDDDDDRLRIDGNKALPAKEPCSPGKGTSPLPASERLDFKNYADVTQKQEATTVHARNELQSNGEWWRSISTAISDKWKRVTDFEVYCRLTNPAKNTYPNFYFDMFVRKMRILPDGRLVLLCRPGDSFGARASTILIEDGHTEKSIVTDVDPASDMCVSITGDILVARWKAPVVRVFETDGAYREIDVWLKGKKMHKLSLIETDESDNMFVYFDDVHVLDDEGCVVQSVSCRWPLRAMVYSAARRTLYTAAPEGIEVLIWTNGILLKSYSVAHGLKRLQIRDICIAQEDGVFTSAFSTATISRPGEIIRGKVIEVIHFSEKGRQIRAIPHKDGMHVISENYPQICSDDKKIWIACGSDVSAYDLESSHDIFLFILLIGIILAATGIGTMIKEGLSGILVHMYE